MILTDAQYKKLIKYSNKLALNEQDGEDIAHEAWILLKLNPSTHTNLSNKFFYTIVKRACYRFYYNTNTGARKNQDILVEDESFDYIPDDSINLDKVIFFNEIREKFKKEKLTNNEQRVVNTVFSSLESHGDMADTLNMKYSTFTTHLDNVLNKMKKYA